MFILTYSFIVGCNKQSDTEFRYTGSSDPHPGHYLDRVIKQEEISINDDAVVTLYLGPLSNRPGRDMNDCMFCDYKTTIKLFVGTDILIVPLDILASPACNINDYENVAFIRTIDSNEFYSDKYKLTFNYDNNRNEYTVTYNHSEEIIIPNSLFNKDKGVISIRTTEFSNCDGISNDLDVYNHEPHSSLFYSGYTWIYYRKNGENLRLYQSKEKPKDFE